MNWLDIIIFLILIGGIASGYKNGFVGELASIAGLILGIWGAIKFSWWTADVLEGWGLSFSLMPVVAFLITFLIITIIMQIVAGLVNNLLESISLSWLNKLAGIVAGLAKAVLFTSVVLLVLGAVDERNRILPKRVIEKSALYKPVSEFVPTLLPFLKLEQLRKEPDQDDLPDKEI